MRKFVFSTLICGLLFTSFAAAEPGKAVAAHPAALSGNIAVSYTFLQDNSIWNHIYTIEKFDPATGTFSGTGHLIADPAYSEIITGAVAGNLVTFHILYTGTNANYQVDAMGTLDCAGHLHGVAISVGQSFTWVGSSDPG